MPEGLPWFRADTNFPTNDKVLELVGMGGKGKAAAFVYFCSLAHAVGQGTDGLIKKAVLPFVHGTPAEARILVDARLWVLVEGGWKINNFGSRQVVGAESQAIHDAKVAAGKAGAEKRWGSER